MKFTENLTAALSSVKDEEIVNAAKTLEPLKPENEVLGVLSSDLQKLFVVAFQGSVAERNSVREELVSIMDSEKGDPRGALKWLTAVHNRIQAGRFRDEAMRKFFWTSVREELGIWSENDISLGSDWQVVAPIKLCQNCNLRHRHGEDFEQVLGIEIVGMDELDDLMGLGSLAPFLVGTRFAGAGRR